MSSNQLTLKWPRKTKSDKRSLEVSGKLVLIPLPNNILEPRGFAACFPN